MKKCFRVAAIFIALAGFATVGQAQDEEGGGDYAVCGDLHPICGGGGHNTSGGPGGGVRYAHTECRTCLSSGGCHPGCDVSLVPSARNAYIAILAAAARQDIVNIVKLSEAVPGFVVFNSDRSSIQIASCDKVSVVANIPIRKSSELALASQLPRSANSPRTLLALALAQR